MTKCLVRIWGTYPWLRPSHIVLSQSFLLNVRTGSEIGESLPMMDTAMGSSSLSHWLGVFCRQKSWESHCQSHAAHEMKPSCYPWPSAENSILVALYSLNTASMTSQFHAIVNGIAHRLQLGAEFSVTLPSRISLLLFYMFTCPFTVPPPKKQLFSIKSKLFEH